MTAVRAGERAGAAIVRAVSGEANAEFRAQHLSVGEEQVPLATPYVAVDLHTAPQEQRRGVADALGLLLLHSDRSLHRSLSPEPIFQHLIFDVLEQLRCEALAPQSLPGLRTNLRASFQAWCAVARSERLHESFIGLLLYTVLHMARNRLIDPLQNEEDEDIIESTRARLGRIIGADLRRLIQTTEDQERYAQAALRIAESVAALAGDAATSLDTSEQALTRSRLQIPDWTPRGAPTPEKGAELGVRRSATGDLAQMDLDTIGGYHVFTTAHDREFSGDQIYRSEVRVELRAQLDSHVTAQAVSIPRLALRLQGLLAHPIPDGWRFGTEDGLLDARRLPQLVANPEYRDLFRDQPLAPLSHSAVSFLVDNSGSMKRQKFEAVAVLLDTFCRALDRIGVPTEVLGFSTRRWNGGRPLQEWQAAGKPADPGRLTELQHIVYKSADTPWKRSRRSLASLMRTHHYRESVDGEALLWAYRRLLPRSEPRKILVMVSDGAPADSATANANGTSFLDAHLRAVAHGIERQALVELSGITIDAEIDDVFADSMHLDLSGTLTLGMYAAVMELFR